MPGAFSLGTQSPNSPKGSAFQSVQPSIFPVGIIQMFAGSVAPSGWLLCDGSLVSRNTYASLFSVIGTLYGSGDNNTTFALPDCRGRAVIGTGQSSDSNMTNRVLGTKYGLEGSTISASMLPTFSMDSDSNTGNHTHGYTAFNWNTNYPPMTYTGLNTPSTWTWSVAGGTLFSVLHNTAAQTNLNITSSGNHTHTRTNSTPTKVDIVQPSLAMNFIIKT